MFEITVYRIRNTWFFDDISRGIVSEPFVCGASEMLQHHINKKYSKRKRKGVKIQFSTIPIPNCDIKLTVTEKCYPLTISQLKTRFGDWLPNHKNNVQTNYSATPTSAYYVDQEGNKCWLCPAQLKFFGNVADEIYAIIL